MMEKIKEKVKEFVKENKLLVILLIVIFFLLLLLGWVYGSILMKFKEGAPEVVKKEEVDYTASEVQIAEEEKKDNEVFNVLVVGSDSRDPNEERGRSDTMMMISLNKSENKATVVSFLRDSLVDIEGHGRTRLGHSYAYGGVGLTVNTINQTYGLDIQNYVVVNFESLVQIIDQIGGITIMMTQEEADYYRTTGMGDFAAGEVTLNGEQALAHSRNRTVGSDFDRTHRQRSVMRGIYQKIMQEKDATTILPLVQYCLKYVKTNLDLATILELATDVLSMKDLLIQQAALPTDGTYTGIKYNGMSVLEIDIDANKVFLEDLLY